MRWYRWVGLVVVVAMAVVGYKVVQISNSISLPQTEEELAEVRARTAAQDEDAFYRPDNSPMMLQDANPLKNVYFGDLHVHTTESMDAYLFGNRLDMDTAYRVAKGEGAIISSGERVELTRPLDFAALTDHAEGFGRGLACASPGLNEVGRDACDLFESPSIIGFLSLRNSAVDRPLKRDNRYYNGDEEAGRRYAAQTWERVKQAAERHYEPGTFTTFAAYEYSRYCPIAASIIAIFSSAR